MKHSAKIVRNVIQIMDTLPGYKYLEKDLSEIEDTLVTLSDEENGEMEERIFSFGLSVIMDVIRELQGVNEVTA